MARAGLLDGYRATVHWEDLEDLAAAHPEIDVVPDRFVIDRNRVTIGGAAPAQDFMLHLIRARHGAALARQVALSFLTTPRRGRDPQTGPAPDPALDPRVARAVARMEARLDAPESRWPKPPPPWGCRRAGWKRCSAPPSAPPQVPMRWPCDCKPRGGC